MHSVLFGEETWYERVGCFQVLPRLAESPHEGLSPHDQHGVLLPAIDMRASPLSQHQSRAPPTSVGETYNCAHTCTH